MCSCNHNCFCNQFMAANVGCQISYNGLVAIFVGAFFTILLGAGLMSLVFFSARHGFDEQVDHDLESLLERHKDS